MSDTHTIKWTDIPANIVLAAAELCDGHTIMDPKAFLEVGVPQEMVDRCTTIYESDFSNPKYTISGPDGKPVNQMRGIYGLDALSTMIRDFDIHAPAKFGRGSQAYVWRDELRKRLDPKPEESTV
jgi:hypothetical protein